LVGGAGQHADGCAGQYADVGAAMANFGVAFDENFSCKANTIQGLESVFLLLERNPSQQQKVRKLFFLQF
jgi:hypothetical protein